jgi:hypothetical protein
VIVAFILALALATTGPAAVAPSEPRLDPPVETVETTVPDDADASPGEEPPAESDASSEAAQDQDDDATEPPPKEPPPGDDPAGWTARVLEVEQGLVSGTLDTTAADDLFRELTRYLTDQRRRMDVALDAAERGLELGETQELAVSIQALYRLRIRLIPNLSPAYRAELLGRGYRGVVELKSELSYVGLGMRYQRTLVPQLVGEWLNRIAQAPLPTIWGFFQLVVIVALFRAWRVWARTGLPRWRESLVATRTRARIRWARFIWYFDQVRRPLEWLLLAELFFSVLDLSLVKGDVERLSAILRWTLLAWVLVRFIHAAAARGKAGLLTGDVARLRLRSLRTLACWLVLLGLGLDLAESYAGRGAIYAWVWMTFKTLMIPVALLLLVWWRPTIFARLEREPKGREWIQRVLRHRTWFRGFLGAAVGGLYLLGLYTIQWIMQIVTVSEWGRGLQSHWYRLGVARAASDRNNTVDTDPLPVDVQAKLLEGDGNIIEKVGRETSRRLGELIDQGTGGVAAIVADRGFGKTTLIQRLGRQHEGKLLIVDCPPGGCEPLMRALARELEIDPETVSAQAIVDALVLGGYSAVAIDNYHRLARPIMGGQAEIERFAEVVVASPRELVWIALVNRAAWRYISRVRSHRLAVEEVYQLRTWTEAEISDLIDLRCRAAGIEPDFEQLILPRRLDDGDYPSLADCNRAKVFRLIWDIGGGSPAAAVRIWMESLGVGPKGKIVVHVPSLPQTAAFEKLDISFLLVLRVILQCELATLDDIVRSLRLAPRDARGALRLMQLREWVEIVDGRYRITDAWYGTVTRVLGRRNLISAREGVGVI